MYYRVTQVLLALTTPILASCTHLYTYHYANAAVMIHEGWSPPTVVSGTDDVLVYHYESMYLPFPDAVSGFSLFVTLSPHRLQRRSSLVLPDPSASAAVSQLRAPSYETGLDPTGSIEIMSVTPTEVVATIDLNCPALKWAYRGTITFTTASTPTLIPERSPSRNGLTLHCSGSAPAAAERSR